MLNMLIRMRHWLWAGLLTAACTLEEIDTDFVPEEPADDLPGGRATGGSKGKASGGTSGRSNRSSLSAGRVATGQAPGAAGDAGSNPEPSQGPRSTAGTAGHSKGAGGEGLSGGAEARGFQGAGGAGGGLVSEPGPAGAGGTSVANTPTTGLYFSEYVEGKSNNKALEISASEPCVLDGCAVEIYLNGAALPGRTLALQGELLPAVPLVLCDRLFAEPERCDRLGALSFNGNDLVRLVCADRVLDSIGTLGVAPEQQWGTGELRTYDMTLRRKCHVTEGDRFDGDAFDPALEWVAVGLDVFQGLGTHCPPDQTDT